MNKIFLILISILILSSCNNSNSKVHSDTINNSDSVQILSKLITHDSLNPSLFADRAKIYLQRGKIDPALRDLQSALKLTPNDPSLFLLLSDIYFVLGQTDNSIASLKKSIRLNPDSEIPYLKLSETYLLLNKPSIAIQYADEAININRKNAESYYIKAMALLENKDTLNAIVNLSMSANRDTSNYMTFMQLGIIYTVQGDSLSKANFKHALSINPDDERALFYLGMYYQEHGKFKEAIENYSKIAELYPDNKRVYYNMGYIYLVELEDFENAKIMFQEAVLINPRYVEAVYNLGRTQEAMGDYESARTQYKKSLELLPNYPLAVQAMNRLDDILIRKNN